MKAAADRPATSSTAQYSTACDRGGCIPNLICHTLRLLLLITLQQAAEHTTAQHVKGVVASLTAQCDRYYHTLQRLVLIALQAAAVHSTAFHMGEGCVEKVVVTCSITICVGCY